MSPTERTLKECRDRDWVACVVERQVTRKVKRDAFGFGDLLVLDDQPGALLIQTTTSSHLRVRVKKCLAAPHLIPWLSAGNRCEVWAWGLKGARGKRKLWKMSRVLVTLDADGAPISSAVEANAGTGATP